MFGGFGKSRVYFARLRDGGTVADLMGTRLRKRVGMVGYLLTAVLQQVHGLSETRERRAVQLLCVATDALLLWFAYQAAALSRVHTLMFLDSLGELARDQGICLGASIVGIFLAGGYNSSRISDRFDSFYYATLGMLGAAVPIFALVSLSPDSAFAISRREVILAPAIALAVVGGWRFIMGGIAARFASLHRYFYVFGPIGTATRIATEISERPGGRADARYLALDQAKMLVEKAPKGARPFYSKNAIIASDILTSEEPIELLEFCEEHFGRTFVYPSLNDMLLFQHHRLLAVGGVPLIEVRNNQVIAPYTLVKRAFDMAVASVGLLLALPICAITALLIKITSPGPIFYTQERMGLDGRPFPIFKFRSMVTDAEAKTGAVWAQAVDPRVTPVGRFIRKHRIDEIPQLFNVLRGDMSMIGPRPERPKFHEEFCAKWPLFNRRLSVRPGVTSLSHVLGSYDSTPEDRLRYDLMYISSVSLVTDLKILLATVRVVLGAKGAQ